MPGTFSALSTEHGSHRPLPLRPWSLQRL